MYVCGREEGTAFSHFCIFPDFQTSTLRPQTSPLLCQTSPLGLAKRSYNLLHLGGRISTRAGRAAQSLQPVTQTGREFNPMFQFAESGFGTEVGMLFVTDHNRPERTATGKNRKTCQGGMVSLCQLKELTGVRGQYPCSSSIAPLRLRVWRWALKRRRSINQ